VLHPYIRKDRKPRRPFQALNWEDALSIFTEKLQHVLKEHGPESVLHLEYGGNGGLLTWHFPLRFWNAIGATKTDYSICSKSGHEALVLHYGSSSGIQPEKLSEQRLIVYWGFNSAVSSPHMWQLSQKARKRNDATIVVVDPRKSQSANLADIWLAPKPGSDVALTFGLIRFLIENEYVDMDFIKKWTKGYEQLKGEAMRWTPKKVEAATGVEWRLIEQLGEAYGVQKPSATMIGLGIQKNHHGAEAVRAIALLPALVGLHRGFFYSNSKAYKVDLPYLTGEKLTKHKIRTVSQVALGPIIERGDFKFIFIFNMNPVLTLPRQSAFRKGLSRSDVFVVVHETHWTETTEYADLVLPAPTFLEKEDLVIPWGHHYVRLSKKCIEPHGESRDEVWIMQEFAKRMGLEDEWLYEDPWRVVETALENALEDGTFTNLLEGKILKLLSDPIQVYPTPSGKIEIFSSLAKKIRIRPIPEHTPLKLKKGDFVLLNSALSKYTHTQFQEVYGPIPAIVQIHPEDAESNDIQEGDVITLLNEQGQVGVKVQISSSVQPGILWSPRQFVGLKGESHNSLTSGQPQIIGKGSVYNSTIVRITKGRHSKKKL
ncbi:MAG: molybdopterin-dependent oxidoreductase, partial [Promethearchaeota archaeon]